MFEQAIPHCAILRCLPVGGGVDAVTTIRSGGRGWPQRQQRQQPAARRIQNSLLSHNHSQWTRVYSPSPSWFLGPGLVRGAGLHPGHRGGTAPSASRMWPLDPRQRPSEGKRGGEVIDSMYGVPGRRSEDLRLAAAVHFIRLRCFPLTFHGSAAARPSSHTWPHLMKPVAGEGGGGHRYDNVGQIASAP